MQIDDMKGWGIHFDEDYGTIFLERDFYDTRNRLQTLYIMSILGSNELKGGGFKDDIEERTHIHGNYDKVSKYIGKKWNVDMPPFDLVRTVLKKQIDEYINRKYLNPWK